MLKTLLATDKIASQFGSGLNPRLRKAIGADLSFPAKATAPETQHADDETLERFGIPRLSDRHTEDKRDSA